MLLSTICALGWMTCLASAQLPGTLSNGLVSYYKFNGNYLDSGASANSFSSISLGTSFTTNRFGVANTAVVFASFADAITTTSNLSLTSGSSFTLSIWAKPSSTAIGGDGNPGGNLIQTGLLNASMDNYGAWLITSFYPLVRGGTFAIDGGFSIIEHNSAFAQVFDNWHQFIYAYDGSISASKIYIDGIEKLTQVGTGNLTNERILTPTPLTVGNYTYSDNGNTAGGYADTPFSDLMIYDRALSPIEVADLYNAQSVPEPSAYALLLLSGAVSLLALRHRKS
jgi:hypothetical protein